jgi:metal-dependent HD superfamily phosphatase/phosphodiesterase
METFRVIAVERKFGKVINRTMLGDVYSNVHRAKHQLRTWYGVKRFNEVADRIIVGSCRPRWHTRLTFIIANQSFYEEIASYTGDELEAIANG